MEKLRNVRTHEHRRADLDPGVKDFLLPIGGQLGIGLFPMAHDSRDASAEMLLVEEERFFALPAIVHIDVESHLSGRSILRFAGCRGSGARA